MAWPFQQMVMLPGVQHGGKNFLHYINADALGFPCAAPVTLAPSWTGKYDNDARALLLFAFLLMLSPDASSLFVAFSSHSHDRFNILALLHPSHPHCEDSYIQ